LVAAELVGLGVPESTGIIIIIQAAGRLLKVVVVEAGVPTMVRRS
jgi:hypothetical protein